VEARAVKGALTTAGLVAAAIVVPGGLIMISAFGVLYAAARSGIAGVDRPAIRGNAIAALLAVFKLEATPTVARAFVRGVLVNEGAYTPGADGRYPLGDVGHRLGPAVGPGQVLSGLHLARLGFKGDPLELARVGSEFRALYYAASIFREAWTAAGGDVREAIRRYNGSGAAAEAYAERAIKRIGEFA
jgi:hypothetical protein